MIYVLFNKQYTEMAEPQTETTSTSTHALDNITQLFQRKRLRTSLKPNSSSMIYCYVVLNNKHKSNIFTEHFIMPVARMR